MFYKNMVYKYVTNTITKSSKFYFKTENWENILYYYVIVRLKTNINISRTKSQIYIAVVNLYLLV